jgi:PEGA domain-containing protein
MALALVVGPALFLSIGSARAQPAPPAGASTADSSQDRKSEAEVRFYKGKKLSAEGAWSAALAEFQASRKLYANESATRGAAVCLRRLARFDEALDLFEIALREFADTMEARTKADVQREIVELRGLVGTIDVEQAEPGAAITLDGQSRGDFPLLAPLRVATGSHTVRAYKEGFAPFETRVEVAGGQTARIAARLIRLVQVGTLQITEAHGRALTVIVDGLDVGTTSAAPLALPLAPGKHVVLLRGEGNLGTAPASVVLRVNEVAPLRLEAEVLDASLRIAPVPLDAQLSLDAVALGRGVWEGHVRAGAHTLEIAAEGFLPATRALTLAHDGTESLAVQLERDPRSLFWRKPPPPPHFVVELATAALIVPSFGGDVAGACDAGCSAGIGIGSYSVIRGGYQRSSGLGFGVTAGALTAKQKPSARSTTLNIVGKVPDDATAFDMLSLRGLVLGAWVGYALDAGLPIHLRLGAGGVFGSLSDARHGSFLASSDGASHSLGSAVETQPARFVFVTPEVRVGWPLGKHVEINAGIEIPLLFAVPQPRWSAAQGIHAGPDGYGSFNADALVSGVLVTIAPTVGARFDL